MNEEITASASMDAETWLPASNREYRRGTFWLGVSGLAATILLVISNLVLASSHGRGPDWITLITVPAVFGVLLVVRLVFGEAIQKKKLALSPDYGKPITWTLSERGIEARLSGSHTFMEWPATHKSVATPKGAFVYLHKNLFWWLPRTAFTSDTDYQRFLQLLAAKTKHFRVG